MNVDKLIDGLSDINTMKDLEKLKDGINSLINSDKEEIKELSKTKEYDIGQIKIKDVIDDLKELTGFENLNEDLKINEDEINSLNTSYEGFLYDENDILSIQSKEELAKKELLETPLKDLLNRIDKMK